MLASQSVCRACRMKALQSAKAAPQTQSRRNLSSASISRVSPFRSLQIPQRRHAFRKSAILGAAAQVRHASNQSLISDPASPSIQTSPELLSDQFEIAPQRSLESLDSQHLGFLADYGIDFGWGPSSCIAWIFEHIHVWSGMPMIGSIVITCGLLRLSMIPIIVRASDNAAKMKNAMNDLKPVQEKMRAAAAKGDQMALAKARAEVSKVYRQHGVKWSKMLTPLFQIPIGFGLWRLMSNMSHSHVDGLSNGGALWFQNLTIPDPYFLLPVATAGTQYLAAKINFDAQGNSMNPQLKAVVLYGLPAISVVVVGFQPAAVGLSFATTAAAAAFTNWMMVQPWFREYMKMSPMKKTATSADQGPYNGTITVSATAHEHPDNIRAERMRAEQAANAVSIAQKVRPSYIKKRLYSFVKGASDGMNKLMPGAGGAASGTVRKAAKNRANAYEVKRAKELKKERLEFEREMKIKNRI